MNFAPNQNALLRHADTRARFSRAACAAGWMLVFGAMIGATWLHCYLHPIGAAQ